MLRTYTKMPVSLRLEGFCERIPFSGCWIFTGHQEKNGYCKIRAGGKSEWVHRAAYLEYVGPIPTGMDVCHSCDVRSCFNPNHLFAGTRRVNMADAVAKSRQAKGFKLPQTKLSAEDVLLVLERVKSGEKYQSIAQFFGVCRQRIGLIALNVGIRRHKTWQMI